MPSLNDRKDLDLKKVEQKLLKEPHQPARFKLSKKEFLRDAAPQEMHVFGETLYLKPRRFSSGKIGFFTQGKIPFEVAGKKYTLQTTCTYYAPESAKWPEGEEEEEDSDGGESDSEDEESAIGSPKAKRIRAEKGHYMFRNVWIKDAPSQQLDVFGKKCTLHPREFKNTGSVGYHCDGEFTAVVNGEEVVLKASMIATVVGSKAWPRG